MTDAEWIQWVDLHATLFGFTRKPHVAMYAKWRKVFTKQGYTLVELEAATLHLGAYPPRRGDKAGTMLDHLSALQEHVRNARRSRNAKPAQAPQLYTPASDEEWRKFREWRKKFREMGKMPPPEDATDGKGDSWEG